MNYINFTRKIRRFLAAGAAAAMLFTGVWNDTGSVLLVHAEEETKSSLNVAYHTQAEISARIKNDGVTQEDPLNYVVDPSFAPPYDNVGVLAPDTLNNAMKMMNQIRYIAGLQDNVTLNEEYNRKAQAAAYVNLLNRNLSHYPTKPAGMADSMYDLGRNGASSSNIAMASWKCSLNWTIVQGWMEDGDASNIDRVGHRRWILNPSMGQTGFGAVYGPGGTYSALYCFDRTRSASETQVAWPAQNMPVGYFNKIFPWSISMGTNVDKNAVRITLKRVNDGKIWNFSAGASNGYFNVDNGGYGQTGCIIFRPEGITGYQAGDIFEVSITGSGIKLSYHVNFFDPDNVTPEENIVNIDWAAANALLDTVPDGGAADILTGCKFTVPAETVNKIAGRNILCAFHMDSDIVIGIAGTTVQQTQTPWNIAVTYKSFIPEALSAQSAQIKKDATATRTINLESNGTLPASVNLHIGWGTQQAGKQAVLYGYDEATGTLFEAGRFTITENGQSMFSVSGNGHYIGVVK